MHSQRIGQPAINLQRLREEMTALSEIGRVEGIPGINRPGFSDADMEARTFMAERMKAAGLQVSMDAVGNLSGLWKTGSGPAVMVGSHLDTVPMGGFFDGALGVAAALECVRTLMESGAAPPCPIEVIATAEEEGRFGGMLGAQALAGAIDDAWFRSARDESGVTLVEAMRAQGLEPDRAATAARDSDTVKAFIELHIEQGPVLDTEGIPIGIVEAISGVFKWSVTLTGIANHAGTTPMNLRRDAFVGLATFACRIPEIIATAGTDQSRVTIGSVEVQPNHPHTVPGKATFALIGRDADGAVMARACRRVAGAAARHRRRCRARPYHRRAELARPEAVRSRDRRGDTPAGGGAWPALQADVQWCRPRHPVHGRADPRRAHLRAEHRRRQPCTGGRYRLAGCRGRGQSPAPHPYRRRGPDLTAGPSGMPAAITVHPPHRPRQAGKSAGHRCRSEGVSKHQLLAVRASARGCRLSVRSTASCQPA